MKKNSIYFLLITVLLSVFASMAVTSVKGKRSATYFYNRDSTPASISDFRAEEYPDFTYAAEYAVKAVVHVKVVKRGTTQPYSFFDFFFDSDRPQRQREQIGVGSGVVITEDGYIVTGNHVISGADDIEVTLEDKQIMKATLVGADPVTDIALLKIDAAGLPYLPFGDSDALRLGEWVLAIGNPYDLRSTVTAGIVSAKARTISTSRLADNEFKIEAFIQTDVAVNSGNSGGALINNKGELVGINTAIVSSTGAFAGYSFAVPTTIVKKTVEDLMDFGLVNRALMGVSMQEIDGILAAEKGLKDTKGVYIVDVNKGSAADKGGVKSGDVLLAVNSVSVNSYPAVQEQVSRYSPNESIKLKLLRDGKELETSITLDARPESLVTEKRDVFRLYGAELAEVSPEKLEKMKIESGVEVLSVSEGRFQSAGIKPGFIITYINQYQIKNITDLQTIIQRSRRSISIEGVYADGETVYYGMGI